MECLATGVGSQHNGLRSLSADGEQQGVFDRIWQVGLQEYDELEGIAWEWQSLDGVMTKAPFGGAATGANPTDRGKRGTKRRKPE
jgi:hypothetical protein